MPSSIAGPQTSIYGGPCASCLAIFLAHHRERVVILIDEYDSPIHAGYATRYYAEVIDFLPGLPLAGPQGQRRTSSRACSPASCASPRRACSPGSTTSTSTRCSGRQFATASASPRRRCALLARALGQRRQLSTTCGPGTTATLFGGEVIYNPWSVLCSSSRDEDAPALLDRHQLERPGPRAARSATPAGPRPSSRCCSPGGTLRKPVLDEDVALCGHLRRHPRRAVELPGLHGLPQGGGGRRGLETHALPALASPTARCGGLKRPPSALDESRGWAGRTSRSWRAALLAATWRGVRGAAPAVRDQPALVPDTAIAR